MTNLCGLFLRKQPLRTVILCLIFKQKRPPALSFRGLRGTLPLLFALAVNRSPRGNEAAEDLCLSLCVSPFLFSPRYAVYVITL